MCEKETLLILYKLRLMRTRERFEERCRGSQLLMANPMRIRLTVDSAKFLCRSQDVTPNRHGSQIHPNLHGP